MNKPGSNEQSPYDKPTEPQRFVPPPAAPTQQNFYPPPPPPPKKSNTGLLIGLLVGVVVIIVIGVVLILVLVNTNKNTPFVAAVFSKGLGGSTTTNPTTTSVATTQAVVSTKSTPTTEAVVPSTTNIQNLASPVERGDSGASTPIQPVVTYNKTAIQNAINALPATTSVVVLLPDGNSVEDDPTRQMPSASTIKLWIAATVLEEAKAGRINLAESYAIKGTDIVSGTGIIGKSVGKSFTFDQLIDTMLTYSDNSVANILIDKLGGFDKVNVYAQRNGYSQTRLQRRLADVNNPNNNLTSGRDAATLMQRLYQGQIVDKGSSSKILAALDARRNYSADQNFFSSKLPGGVDYRHISGTGTGVRNEVGYFVTSQGVLIIAVFVSEAGNEQGAEDAISTMVQQIYQALKS